MSTTPDGIYYAESGAGEPLVFLHGLTLDHRMWDDVVPAFARERRCLALDLRGHGRSAPFADGASDVADLIGVLDHAGVDRCDLVGLSRGGMVAIHAAGLHPDRVRRLVLVDAYLPTEHLKDWRPIRDARSRGPEAVRAAWLGDALFAPAQRDPAVARRLREMVEGNDLAIWFKRFAPADEPSVLEQPARITRPTAIIVGELDLPGFRALAEWLHRTIPGARHHPLVTIPDAGHMVPMERPEAFNAALRAFLARPLP